VQPGDVGGRGGGDRRGCGHAKWEDRGLAAHVVVQPWPMQAGGQQDRLSGEV
jgi:hypothetical protein